MTTPTERDAAKRALAAWRAKNEANARAGRRPSTSPKGDALDRKPGWSDEEAAELGVTPHPLVCPHVALPGGEARWDSIDLLDAMVLTDLTAAGVPALVLALYYEDAERARVAAEVDPDEALRHCAEERGKAVAFPLSYPLAEVWLSGLGGRPWRIDPEAVGEAVERGEAIAYREAKAAARLVRAIDAWWVKHA